MPVTRTPDFVKILLYFVGIIVLGAALAPPLFFAGKSLASALAAHGHHDTPVLGSLQDVASRTEFSRYFKRAFMLAALLCLWPTIRWLRASGPITLGLRANPDCWAHLFFGVSLSAGLLLAMGVGFHQSGAYVGRAAPASAWWQATVAAFGAGTIEEILFRGLFFALFLRTFRPFTTLLLVTTLFAGVHFLNPPPEAALDDSQVGWLSGFWLTGQTFKHFGDFQFLIAEFSTLFAVGWVLGIARLRTGSLWLPIGLHTGWIFGLKIFSSHFGVSDSLRLGEWLPWIGVNIKIGVVPLLVVSITGVLVALLFKKAGPAP